MRKLPTMMVACGALLCATFAANAQTSAESTEFGAVIDKCVEVSENPDIADPTDGICVTETRTYLGSLEGLPDAEVDTKLTDLVVALGELPRAGGRTDCNGFDDEIAQAIRIASESSPDSLQQERILVVAQTIVETCGDPDSTTAAIASQE